ncbi:MAG: response regulator [Burkholderiaceae bacterium]
MTQTVVIVDDSLTVRMDLRDAFEAAGFVARACATAAQAREAFAAGGVDVAVLDVQLPDGDGVELLRELRASEAGADVVVLMLSSASEVAQRIRGLRTGADEYVGKPYDPQYVIAKARELLRRRRGAHAQTRATVLLVDDSATFRHAMREALEGAGYDVATAASGEDGLRLAAELRPSAIVVDGQLPGIDGMTVVRRVRLDAALRGVPCLLLTGSHELSVELQALDAGADAFVHKDEEIPVILARLGAALRATERRAGDGPSSLLAPKKVLAVDDSTTYLRDLADVLREEGYDVVCARSGEQALELLSVQAVDCILMDLQMPGLDGRETCLRIKGAPGVRDIPLIMLTALDDRAAMLAGLGAGADDYLQKSSEFEVIKARVRAQLRRKQFEDENRRIREELLHEASETRAARELAQARAELVEQLERKTRELELATQAKSRFLAMMSHEIRTPLNAVIGMAGLLDKSELSDQQREYAGIIRTSGDHLLAVINDILDFSSLEFGGLALESRSLAVANVVEESLDLVAGAARAKEIELTYELAPGVPPTVLGDAGRIRQILVNYLSNAVKFTAQGEVVVTVEARPLPDGRHELHGAVRDTGRGIPPDRFDRLFHSFSQVDASVRREFGGTGLGLAICKRLAELMGGRVWVESEAGRGSTFHFTVVAAVPDEPRPVEPAVAPKPLTGVRAWIVDDNDANRLILRRQLQDWGLDIRDTGSPEEALAWARRGDACDLAILDFHMPAMDGVQLARALHDLRGPALKQVVLTSGLPVADSEARAAGLLAQLSKPVKHRPLLNTVLKLFEGRVVANAAHVPAAVPAVPVAPQASSAGGGLRILVAEDNPINVYLLKILLEHSGLESDVVGNGQEAVDAVRERRYDVVFMDVQMPVMDGTEATRRILEEHPAGDRPRIIALTAGVMADEVQACRDAGVDDFLAKPIDPARLAASLARCRRRDD